MQNDLKFSISDKSNLNYIFHITLSKNNSLNLCRKYTIALFFFGEVILTDEILFSLILFQLLNLHLWQPANCTLNTAQCTLHTAPEPSNAPASVPVN